MRKFIWATWILVTLAIAGYYGYILLKADNKQALLIGETSHGHFQIELACSSCHTEAFGGPELIQEACVGCHGAELAEANDTHPKKKFTDPRNADRLSVVDARYCVSCHTEHHREITAPMGVTLPEDYCFHCHTDVGDDRESHRDLAFDSCASAGCHNYHDNRALFEDFLVHNHSGPWLKEMARLTNPNGATILASKHVPEQQPTFPKQRKAHPDIHQAWSGSSHADAGVDCGGCHSDASSNEWLEKPGIAQCQTCHIHEAESYKSGKHGMRLAQSLPAIRPADSKLPFKETALSLQQGCNSCHSAHRTDTLFAASEACLTCHNDEHSRGFDSSPHGQLLTRAIAGVIPVEQAVSCATCHMPRAENIVDGETVVQVNHNQNHNLRPNEKMIRPVCMQCHNLGFSIDALADPALIRNNFNGKPATHIPSIDWSLKRVAD